MSHAIVDADIIAYRISFACKDETEKHAKYSLDNYLNDILTSDVIINSTTNTHIYIKILDFN